LFAILFNSTLSAAVITPAVVVVAAGIQACSLNNSDSGSTYLP